METETLPHEFETKRKESTTAKGGSFMVLSAIFYFLSSFAMKAGEELGNGIDILIRAILGMMEDKQKVNLLQKAKKNFAPDDDATITTASTSDSDSISRAEYEKTKSTLESQVLLLESKLEDKDYLDKQVHLLEAKLETQSKLLQEK